MSESGDIFSWTLEEKWVVDAYLVCRGNASTLPDAADPLSVSKLRSPGARGVHRPLLTLRPPWLRLTTEDFLTMLS